LKTFDQASAPWITAGTLEFKFITIYPTFKTRWGEKAIRYLVLAHHHMRSDELWWKLRDVGLIEVNDQMTVQRQFSRW
jgi:hypothetical protein